MHISYQSLNGAKQGRNIETNTTHTDSDNLESPVNFTCMSLEYSERTHRHGADKCHTERPRSGIQLRKLFLL